MTGIAEASAIVAVITNAVKISDSLYGLASKIGAAASQIQLLGKEIETLARVLKQIQGLEKSQASRQNEEIWNILSDILQQCEELLSQITTFRDSIIKSEGPANSSKVSLYGKLKFIFKANELEYLRARLESVKVNLLLVVTMERSNSLSKDPRSSTIGSSGSLSSDAHGLISQGDAISDRLETLELEMSHQHLGDDNKLDDRQSKISWGTHTSEVSAMSRSTLDSIIAFYGIDEDALDLLESPTTKRLGIRFSWSRTGSGPTEEEGIGLVRTKEMAEEQYPYPSEMSLTRALSLATSPSPQQIRLVATLVHSSPNNYGSTRHPDLPYLYYKPGEIFNVFAESGDLWLAINQEDPQKQRGWISKKHCLKLPTG